MGDIQHCRDYNKASGPGASSEGEEREMLNSGVARSGASAVQQSHSDSQ